MGKLSTSLKKIMSLYLLWSIFVIVYRFRFVQTKVPILYQIYSNTAYVNLCIT
jgi:hypothetical protein